MSKCCCYSYDPQQSEAAMDDTDREHRAQYRVYLRQKREAKQGARKEREMAARLPWLLLPLVLLALFLMVTLPGAAQTVVDGDTLKFNGTTYRLHGIDAPELHQTCGDWIAGEYSAAFLRQIIEGRKVECEPKTIDRYGRTVALCRADGWDLSSWMVRQGMAWAFVKYSRDYVEQERIAKDLHIGIHGANCQPAWQYRSEKR